MNLCWNKVTTKRILIPGGQFPLPFAGCKLHADSSDLRHKKIFFLATFWMAMIQENEGFRLQRVPLLQFQSTSHNEAMYRNLLDDPSHTIAAQSFFYRKWIITTWRHRLSRTSQFAVPHLPRAWGCDFRWYSPWTPPVICNSHTMWQ